MNWQDAVASFIALCALLVIVRPLVPARWSGRASAAPGCPSCAAGNACAVKPAPAAAALLPVQRRRPPA